MERYIYYVVSDFVGTDEFFDAPIDMNVMRISMLQII